MAGVLAAVLFFTLIFVLVAFMLFKMGKDDD